MEDGQGYQAEKGMERMLWGEQRYMSHRGDSDNVGGQMDLKRNLLRNSNISGIFVGKILLVVVSQFLDKIIEEEYGRVGRGSSPEYE